jgi:hypothetical protein
MKILPRLTLIQSLILTPAVTTPSPRRDPRPRPNRIIPIPKSRTSPRSVRPNTKKSTLKTKSKKTTKKLEVDVALDLGKTVEEFDLYW